MTPSTTKPQLPEPLQGFVGVGAQALGCDESYIAVPLLAAVASAIGNTRRIRLKAEWSEPAVVWAAIVGESGTVKSPALELALKPVWRRQRKLLKEHAQARADHTAELQTWKDTPKDARGERPEPPAPCQHPICSDITVEAAADRLLSTPRGMLLALDELAAWFGSFNQYKTGGGADVAHWLAMHGARALKVDRKGGDRATIYVPHAAVSVTGTIQPDALRRALLPEFFENGLAARLLVCMPPTKAKRWTEQEIPDAINNAMDSLFAKLYALKPSASIDGDEEPMMVDLTDDARATWAQFVDRFNEELQGLEGIARAAAAKLEGYAARFALLFHCIEQATGAKASEYIEATEIDAGIRLANWFGHETARVYRAMNEPEEDRRRRELREWIAGRGGRVTVREMQQNLRRYRNNPAGAEEALNDLDRLGMGSWDYAPPGESGGRPTHRFCLADSPDFPITPRANANGTENYRDQMRVALALSPSEVGAA